MWTDIWFACGCRILAFQSECLFSAVFLTSLPPSLSERSIEQQVLQGECRRLETQHYNLTLTAEQLSHSMRVRYVFVYYLFFYYIFFKDYSIFMFCYYYYTEKVVNISSHTLFTSCGCSIEHFHSFKITSIVIPQICSFSFFSCEYYSTSAAVSGVFC